MKDKWRSDLTSDGLPADAIRVAADTGHPRAAARSDERQVAV
ncbi:gamma-glutamyl ligase domain protein [Mycobacterium tuberculosis variant bovis]|nr:gamma-glutamyl ligase domain protein [Mycobacterium tuberculosis variant bovis]